MNPPQYMSFIGPCVGVVGYQLDPGAVWCDGGHSH